MTDKYDVILDGWQSTLCESIELSALYSRNPSAHKWKILHRCIILRELVAWRFTDLLKQAVVLQKAQHILGARILLRSAMETLALLVYSNQRMETIMHTGEGFLEFSETTTKLILGSRNKSTNYKAINILTILDKFDENYQGVKGMYEALSESAHPNCEGLTQGYSTNDHENRITNFKNYWNEKFGNAQCPIIELLMLIFKAEYSEVWPKNFSNFENWIEANESNLKNE